MIQFENHTETPVNERVILGYLSEICDPEIPVLSIVDLGIVRAVNITHSTAGEQLIEVSITATYTGCPAMDMIAGEIRVMLSTLGFKQVIVKHVLSPAWTTAWMTEQGKQKLLDYGIAPPDKRFTIPIDGVTCPRCSTTNTRLLSEFSSTACKALYQCADCREPFDYFKCY